MAMDPVSQVLAQQESGSAGGQGFGQFYVEGQRQGLSRRRLDLEMQQESRMQKRDDLMLPLETKLTQAQIVNLGIQAETTTQKAQTAMRLNLVVPEIYRLENEFMQSPDGHASPALRQEVLNLSKQYPEAFVGDMPGADLWRKMEAVPMFEQRMKRISEMEQKLQGTGTRIESVDPVTGRINLGQRTMPGTLSTVGKEVADLSALEATDPAAAARFRAAQAQRDLSKGETIRALPGGGFEIIRGAGAGDTKMPTSVVADAEAVANSAASLVQFGREIVNLAQPGNVGAAGNLKRLFGEVAGQFMDVEPGDEFDFAQATTFFRAGATRVLRSDSQITNDERKQIISDLPSKGWVEADETAREKARHAMRRVAESAKRQIRRAGVTLPTELLTVDDKDDIARMVREGKLSVQDAKSALMRKDLF